MIQEWNSSSSQGRALWLHQNWTRLCQGACVWGRVGGHAKREMSVWWSLTSIRCFRERLLSLSSSSQVAWETSIDALFSWEWWSTTPQNYFLLHEEPKHYVGYVGLPHMPPVVSSFASFRREIMQKLRVLWINTKCKLIRIKLSKKSMENNKYHQRFLCWGLGNA